MTTSQDIGKLAEALAKAQAKFENAPKDSENPFYGKKYADLASNICAIRAPLSENGLSVVQGTSAEGALVKISTRLMHSSGQWIEDTLTITATKLDPQGIGSAITYGRRYALAAMVGIAQDDDDGNDASEKAPPKAAPKAQEKAPQASPPHEPLEDRQKKAQALFTELAQVMASKIGEVAAFDEAAKERYRAKKAAIQKKERNAEFFAEVEALLSDANKELADKRKAAAAFKGAA